MRRDGDNLKDERATFRDKVYAATFDQLRPIVVVDTRTAMMKMTRRFKQCF